MSSSVRGSPKESVSNVTNRSPFNPNLFGRREGSTGLGDALVKALDTSSASTLHDAICTDVVIDLVDQLLSVGDRKLLSDLLLHLLLASVHV